MEHELQFQVVNLERRPDRRESFLKANSHIEGLRFEFFAAVDGQSLDLYDVRRSGWLAEKAQFDGGHIACALSHRALAERALHSNDPQFVCEDDAVLRMDFAHKWHELSPQLPAEWDIVLFGYNFDSALAIELIPGVQRFLGWFDNRPIDPSAAGRFQESLQPVLLLKLLNAFGTLSYAMSSRGAEKFINGCFPLRNDRIPIPPLRRIVPAFSLDCMMNKHYHRWNAFAAFPPLAISPNDKSRSDTQDGTQPD